jgi:hypothetical protein
MDLRYVNKKNKNDLTYYRIFFFFKQRKNQHSRDFSDATG